MSRPLPFDCPRGLSRIEAARYVGVSPSTFDKLIAEGRMPRPKRVGARLIFDSREIDLAFDALGGEADSGVNDWD